MDKSKAIERLNALEKETAELRKIIEAPEPTPSLLTKPQPGSYQNYWTVYCDNAGFGVRWIEAISTHPTYYNHGNLFQSRELADDYAIAFNTLLLLRHQPGTVPAKEDVTQFIIEPDWNRNSHAPTMQIRAREMKGLIYKMARVSPSFKSKAHAYRAIETVGEEAILHMFKTLHHVNQKGLHHDK